MALPERKRVLVQGSLQLSQPWLVAAFTSVVVFLLRKNPLNQKSYAASKVKMLALN